MKKCKGNKANHALVITVFLQESAGDMCSTGLKSGGAVTVCREHCSTDGCNKAAGREGGGRGLIVAAMAVMLFSYKH